MIEWDAIFVPQAKRSRPPHRIPFQTQRLSHNVYRGFTMTISLRLRLLAAALLFTAAPALAQRPPDSTPRPFAWWKSEPFKKELGLTADQSTRIDKIWETTRPELRQEWDELSKLEGKLSRLIQNDADEAVLTRQIDRVETARANANKTRSLMLVQMLKVLTTDQRTRFSVLHDRWQKEQGLSPVLPSPAPPRSGPRQDSTRP
jgi:Spy/CpxP family protein refolding chaperone